MIRHVVLFRAQENQFDRVLQGLKILEQIPHASLCEVRPNLKLDEWCQEIDVMVYAEFVSEHELALFKKHPMYHQSIDLVRSFRDIRMVADVMS